MIRDTIVKKIFSHDDSRGFFREIFKINNDFSNITINQVSHSLVNEGIIKGWHGHKQQHQWNYILKGSALIVLYDDRKDSITYKSKKIFTINSEINKVFYYFPPGILHGYKCIKGPMDIIYATSGTYDADEEIKKDIDYESLNNSLIS